MVIASNGGADRDPDWWRNLKVHAVTTVQLGATHIDLRAEEASGSERHRLWSKITSRYAVYRGYERRAKRAIPVLVLRPERA